MVTLSSGASLHLSKIALGFKDKEQQKEPKEEETQIQFNLFNVKSKYFTEVVTKASRSD